jgi:hypothetical protein
MKYLPFLFHIKKIFCLQELPVEVEKVGDEGHEDVSKGVVVLAQCSCYQPSKREKFRALIVINNFTQSFCSKNKYRAFD